MNPVRTSTATIRTTATNPLWMITAALALFAGVMVILISAL